jgi:preprotein translocase subunit SecG
MTSKGKSRREKRASKSSKKHCTSCSSSEQSRKNTTNDAHKKNKANDTQKNDNDSDGGGILKAFAMPFTDFLLDSTLLAGVTFIMVVIFVIAILPLWIHARNKRKTWKKKWCEMKNNDQNGNNTDDDEQSTKQTSGGRTTSFGIDTFPSVPVVGGEHFC